MDNNEKIQFIKNHANEIIPIADEETKNFMSGLKKGERGPDETQLEKTFERFQTKIFLLEKSEFESGAKRALITASEPLAFNGLLPIVKKLKEDPRCKAIGLITDNVAGRSFNELMETEDFADFKAIKSGVKQPANKKTKVDFNYPVFLDAMKMAEKEPFDIAVTGSEPKNSPSTELFFGGKSVFGAKKMVLIDRGWNGVSGMKEILSDKSRLKNMDPIDAIICNDQLAKDIIKSQWPEFPEEKILPIGTPTFDAIQLERADELQKSGMIKLGLSGNEVAVLYLGDISHDYDASIDNRINEKTFSKSLDSMIALAENEPEKEFVLLFRPHPRDPNKEELFEIAKKGLPPNLKVKSAQVGEVSVNEAAYASDFIMSIVSTENILAVKRGKQGIYLGYDGKGMGKKVLKSIYDDEMIKIIRNQENLSVVNSEEQLIEAIQLKINKIKNKSEKALQHERKYTERIIEYLLE